MEWNLTGTLKALESIEVGLADVYFHLSGQVPFLLRR